MSNNEEIILNQKIGRNIKRYRKDNDLIQKDLARKANVSRSTIACLESNNISKGVSVFTLYKISRVLGKEIDNLLN